MKFKQAIQIGDNVTDIYKLPCIAGVFKNTDGSAIFRLELFVKSERAIAVKGDWLCQDYNGNWHRMSDTEYKQYLKNNSHE